MGYIVEGEIPFSDYLISNNLNTNICEIMFSYLMSMGFFAMNCGLFVADHSLRK